MEWGKDKKRANVYIDGFNFYYGVFKGKGSFKRNKYKWLDFLKLGELMLCDYNVVMVKYFTAMVNGFDDPHKPTRQNIYWDALEAVGGKRLEIIKGNFLTKSIKRPIAYYSKEFEKNGNRPIKQSITVMNNEEKGSDVNLAVHLVYDAVKDCYDTALVLSNDSDLATAIKIVKRKLKKKVIIANPQHFRKKPIAVDLKKIHTSIKDIRIEHLKNALLPEEVEIGDGRKVHRPPSWS